jgi:hypothetical protein
LIIIIIYHSEAGSKADHQRFNTSVNHSIGQRRLFLATQLGFSEATRHVRILFMSSHMPTVPAANRSKRAGKSERAVSKDKKLVKHEHHANSAEEGDTANIKQNTTNKGFFRGRRFG